MRITNMAQNIDIPSEYSVWTTDCTNITFRKNVLNHQ